MDKVHIPLTLQKLILLEVINDHIYESPSKSIANFNMKSMFKNTFDANSGKTQTNQNPKCNVVSLQEFVSSDEYHSECYFKYYERVNKVTRHEAILNYAMVCKDWFNIISKGVCNQFYMKVPITFEGYISDSPTDPHERSKFRQELQMKVLTKESERLSKKNALYKFDTIKHIYVNTEGNQVIEEGAKVDPNQHDRIIEFFAKFPKLERITISTQSLALVEVILSKVQGLIISIHLNPQDMDEPIYGHSEKLLNRSVVDFVHLQSTGTCLTIEFSNVLKTMDKYFKNFVPAWRVDSIFSEHDTGHSEGIQHGNYASLFNLKGDQAVKRIVISPKGHVSSDELYLVAKNDHIESFKANIPFGIYDYTRVAPIGDYNHYDSDEEFDEEDADNEKFDDDFTDEYGTNVTSCRCFPYIEEEDRTVVFPVNKLKHWKEFCDELAKNKSLRELSLSNHCTHHRNKPETIDEISETFSSALSVNKTIEKLSFTCQVLSESFYEMLSHSNNTISQLKLRFLSEYHLGLLTAALNYNQSLKRLDLTHFDKRNSKVNRKVISTFADSLLSNKSIKQVLLPNNTIIFDSNFIIDLFEQKRKNIKIIREDNFILIKL